MEDVGDRMDVRGTILSGLTSSLLTDVYVEVGSTSAWIETLRRGLGRRGCGAIMESLRLPAVDDTPDDFRRG